MLSFSQPQPKTKYTLFVIILQSFFSSILIRFLLNPSTQPNSDMEKENVFNVPDNESTGSNGDNAVTTPSNECQICSNPISRNPNKHPLQGPTPPLPPRTNRTTSAVPIGPQGPTLAALWINGNVASDSGTTAATAFPISPQPAALWTFDNAVGSGESLYHLFHPYLKQMDPHPPPRTVDLLSQLGAVRSDSPYSGQMDEQPLRTVDFLSNVNNQPWRTVDYLAQMEAASSAPAAQVPRENPPIETIVQWASSLRVGDGRRRKVDLNLKLKMV